MSWGERSCKHGGWDCKRATMETCNVDCPHYEWDGKTPPDSTTQVKRPVQEKKLGIPRKFQKLLDSGRWEKVTKTDGRSRKWIVGVKRKSTGDIRWFGFGNEVLICK